MPAFNAAALPPSFISPRTGIENMDGHQILDPQRRIYARPRDACIPVDELRGDNLPPFLVRLRDDQDGVWKDKITGTDGKPLALVGGKRLPFYKDLGLPLTYTSSRKIKATDMTGLPQNAGKKRKATDDVAGDTSVLQKRARSSFLATELEGELGGTIFEISAAEARGSRLQNYDPQINCAIQAIDSVIAHYKITGQANAALKANLQNAESAAKKDYDGLHFQWVDHNEGMRERHAAELKEQNGLIAKLKGKVEKNREQRDLQDILIRRVRGDWEVESQEVQTMLNSIEDSMGKDQDESEKEDAGESEGTSEKAPFDGQGSSDEPMTPTKGPDELKMNEARGHQRPQPSAENGAKIQTPEIKNQTLKKENSQPTSQIKMENSLSPATSTLAKKPLWVSSEASIKSSRFEPKREGQPDGTLIMDYTTRTATAPIPPNAGTRGGGNEGLNDGVRRYQACVEEGEGEEDL